MRCKNILKGKGKTSYRLLVSSLCSILLCVCCLTGTTWALFAVSVENTGNVIAIGTPSVALTADGVEYSSGTYLSGGEHILKITHGSAADVFE